MTTAMWRRLDAPGHDGCRLVQRSDGWALEGCAVFRHEQKPCVLAYSVWCDDAFQTRKASVRGWVGRKRFAVEITRDARNNWRLNGRAAAAVRGCVDVDINVSPSTNLLSLCEVRVAWLVFPQAKLAPLEQTYERTGPTTYEDRALDLEFRSRLVVDRHGMVLDYPPLWRQESAR